MEQAVETLSGRLQDVSGRIVSGTKIEHKVECESGTMVEHNLESEVGYVDILQHVTKIRRRSVPVYIA